MTGIPGAVFAPKIPIPCRPGIPMPRQPYGAFPEPDRRNAATMTEPRRKGIPMPGILAPGQPRRIGFSHLDPGRGSQGPYGFAVEAS
jgi:hypothetical protein